MQSPQPEFVALVRDRSQTLLRTARLLTGNWQTAEDLVQVALLRTWQRWDRLNDPAAAEAFTRQVMVRLSCTWWRRRWNGEVPTESVPDVGDRFDVAQAVSVETDLAAALLHLPAKQRACVVLRYYEDLTEEQTAAALRCSLGTVKSNVSRGLAKLRDMTGASSLPVAAEVIA